VYSGVNREDIGGFFGLEELLVVVIEVLVLAEIYSLVIILVEFSVDCLFFLYF
jgi:hypothetical protein